MPKGKERPYVVVGNWKMYKTIEEATAFVDALLPLVAEVESQIFLAVPFTAIQAIAKKLKNKNVIVGAQNMNDASVGAFTGEIAASMLKEAGARFVILGHSERRQIFHEDDAFVNRKVLRALKEGIQPIVCVGETLEQHKAGDTQKVITAQLEGSLQDVSEEQIGKLMLAYEPVWAIGTGETATAEQAEEVHEAIRKFIAKRWSKAIADRMTILYGGSVRPDNAKELIEQKDIDGVLVGGAALLPESFAQIINS